VSRGCRSHEPDPAAARARAGRRSDRAPRAGVDAVPDRSGAIPADLARGGFATADPRASALDCSWGRNAVGHPRRTDRSLILGVAGGVPAAVPAPANVPGGG